MKRATIVAAFTVLLGASCGSAGVGPQPIGGPLVVPGVEGAYYVFRSGSIRREPDGKQEPVAAEAGRPAAVGVDPSGGWAVVAYENAFYSVQLAEGRVVPIAATAWKSPPGALGVQGGLVGAAEGGFIGVYRVADGSREWSAEAAPLLEPAGLRELHFVLPLSATQLLLVAFKGMDPLGYPDTRLVKLDRSGGAAEIVNEQPLRNMHFLGACASDGELVFLGGVQERVVVLPGMGNQQLMQSLYVVQVDPSDLSVRTLVHEEMPGREVEVRRLSVGYGLVAVTLEDGELRVYRVGEGAATRAVFANRYATQVSAACLDPEHIVIVDENEKTQVFSVR
jgi:hypothetical protein